MENEVKMETKKQMTHNMTDVQIVDEKGHREQGQDREQRHR